jgi:hypothetical protein
MSTKKKADTKTPGMMTLGTGKAQDKSPGDHKAVNSLLKRLNVNIDAGLHSRFKSVVAREGSDMTQTLELLLKEWLAKNE